MIDLDLYRPASFRGVPFHVARSGYRISHRVDVKEYPYQDQGLVTDMGLSDDRIELIIFVIGDDFIIRRTALEDAFKKTGPGTLVHPTRGEIQVQIETIKQDEDFSELGVADYTVTFIRSNSAITPTAQVNTQAAVATAAKATETAAPAAFGFKSPTNPAVVTAAESDLTKFTDALASASSKISGATPSKIISGIDAVKSLRASIAGPVNAIKTVNGFANSVTSVTNQWSNLATSPASALKMIAGVSLNGGVRGLVNNGLYNPSASSVIKTATGFATAPELSNTDSQANRDTIAELFDLGLAVDGSKLSSEIKFKTLPEAIATRDVLTNRLDEIAFTEPAAGVDPVAVNQFRSSVRTLRNAVYRDITERASELPTMQSYIPQSVTPARVLSYRLTQNIDTAETLAARNAIAHPSFTPTATPLFFQVKA